MDETLSLNFTVIAEGGTFGDGTPVFGQVAFDPAAAPLRIDAATGEAVYALRDPDAALWIGGVPYDFASYELRVGDNLNFGGVFIVDRLLFTTTAFGPDATAEIEVGAASFTRTTFVGTDLPDGPLGPFDVSNDFGTSLAVGGESPEAPSPDLVRLEILPEGLALAEDIGTGIDAAGAQTVVLLYEAALNRDGNVDVLGVNFWIDRVEEGASFLQLAEAFLTSPEFDAAFGPEAELTDLELVEQLYRNVLDREGDADGIAFWTGRLAEGLGRDAVLLAFAESQENRDGSPEVADLTEVGPGVWDFV
ncbi:MAG: DUF4214 domain-containing protein [Pikeienuella sp.]